MNCQANRRVLKETWRKMEQRFEQTHQLTILTRTHLSFKEQLAATELRRGLLQAGYKGRVVVGTLPGPEPEEQELRFILLAAHDDSEAYTITCAKASPTTIAVTIRGSSEQGLLAGVFAFLERQGAFFSLDGDHYPLDRARTLSLPDPGQIWSEAPRFAVRGLQPWPDFLNCLTVFNQQDYRAYLEAMLRMRFNMLGIHVYTGMHGREKWVEPFLSFEYGSVGHAAFADTTATDRWGYLPQRTSSYSMSASHYFDDEVFGSDAARSARNPWEAAQMAQKLWQDAFAYAEQLGIRTGVGFEPYLLPDEICRACPPEVQKTFGERPVGIDPESRTARTILETRLARLLETYPSVRYIYLWEDELTSWASQQNPESLSVTPFKQAYDFLRRHAPDKRLVLAGWGGMARNFATFHRALPEEIIFTCLSDQFGWDPVNEAFAKLEGRERWPILWIEDDPSMWFPQFHAHRFDRDITLAEQYGCQGLLGIHWRHRIIEPTASFQARRSWDTTFTPDQLYQSYACTQASAERTSDLAGLLLDTDYHHRIISTGTGETRPDGRSAFRGLSGDYNEAFLVDPECILTVPQSLLESQQQVIMRLGRLLDHASTPLERERLGYLYGQLSFVDLYARAWDVGARLQRLITEQYERKQNGKTAEAAAIIREQGVQLWIELLQTVRQAVLAFQHTIATRNDLGTMASLHNKFVRIATFRLRASLLEFLDELPSEAEAAETTALAPDNELMGRVFLPTRPTRLSPGEFLFVTAIAPGAYEVESISLCWRLIGTISWQHCAMELVERRTYTASLSMPLDANPGIEYYVEACFCGSDGLLISTAPASGSERAYLVTV